MLNNPNQTIDRIGTYPNWVILILDVYLLAVALTNLGYNRRAAQASEKIAAELNRINGSKFMNKLNGEIDKEINHEKL